MIIRLNLLSINPISYFIAMAISCAASIPNCEEEVILEYIIEVVESSYCVFPKEQRESKREEYLSYARMFLHEKEHNPISNTPKLDSEYNIALFLDQLEDHNIFVHDNFELKLPKGYQLKGEDKLDLVKKIVGSRFAIDYLNHLYIKDA